MDKQFFMDKSNNIGSLVLYLNNPNNISYVEYLNQNIPSEIIDRSLAEKIWYLINEPKNIQLCICGEHLSFIGFKNGYRKSCGKKECYVESRKKTSLKRYGVDNPKKSKKIKLKEQQKILEKWGGKHYLHDDSVRDKFKSTMLEKYGVEWAQQNKSINEKSLETWKNNPNREEIIESKSNKLKSKTSEEKKSINEKRISSIEVNYGSYKNFIDYRLSKIKESSLRKFGVDHHFKSKEISELKINSYQKNITNKIISKLPTNIEYVDRTYNSNSTDLYIHLKCLKCQNNFEITRQSLYFRCTTNEDPCPNCNPKKNGTSNSELELLEFIKQNYEGKIESNYRNLISKEVDIYLPDVKLGFEFNGLYWHSNLYKERKFHLDKSLECRNLGIELFHVWEDDWIYRKSIVKSMILNKLKKNQFKIFARNCKIKLIENNDVVREFLIQNHIQGFVGSKYKIGLFYNDELVSLMTFGNLRKSLGQNKKEDNFELLRFCNKLNTSVIGGASKLIKYFIQEFKPKQIISYSDLSRSYGNLYKTLGFEYCGLSEPNYYYIVDEMRSHRFNFRKDKLVKQGFDKNKTEIQIMTERKIHRIFDCGMEKWTLNV